MISSVTDESFFAIQIHPHDLNPGAKADLAQEILRELSPFWSKALPLRDEYSDGEMQCLRLVGPELDFWSPDPFFRGAAPVGASFLEKCPRLISLFASFKSPLLQARVVRMSAGSFVRMHRDPWRSFEFGVLRLNIPLSVSESSHLFFLSGLELRPENGEIWYLNAAIGHGASNPGPQARDHLVLDVGVTPQLIECFPDGVREKIRTLAINYFTFKNTTSSDAIDLSFEIEDLFLPLRSPKGERVSVRIREGEGERRLEFAGQSLPLRMRTDGAWFCPWIGPGLSYFLNKDFVEAHYAGFLTKDESSELNGQTLIAEAALMPAAGEYDRA